MDWPALRISLLLGVWTIALLLPAGIWAGHQLATRQFRGKAIVESLIAIPLLLPPTVLGFYLLVTFSARSPLGAAFERVMGHTLGVLLSRTGDRLGHRQYPFRGAADTACVRGSAHRCPRGSGLLWTQSVATFPPHRGALSPGQGF